MAEEPLTERNIGIELLRIVAMLMIVLSHITLHYWNGKIVSIEACSVNIFIRMMVSPCVNIFAMISGWVMRSSKIKYYRFIELYLQCLFYSVIIMVAGNLYCGTEWNWKVFFPVLSKQYWYISAYFGMIVFLPMVHCGLAVFPRKVLYRIALIMMFFSFAAGVLFPKELTIFGGGMNSFWLLCCYVMGSAAGIYYDFSKACRKALLIQCAKLYCLIVLFLFLLTLIGYFAGFPPFFRHLGNFMCIYINPIVIVSALSLLIMFSGKTSYNQIIGKCILFFSPLTLGVYLIHEHYIIRNLLVQCFAPDPTFVRYLLQTSLWLVLIYLGCSYLDYLRLVLFRICQVRRFSFWCESLIKTLVQKIALKLDQNH